jgi:hypothetical protein
MTRIVATHYRYQSPAPEAAGRGTGGAGGGEAAEPAKARKRAEGAGSAESATTERLPTGGQKQPAIVTIRRASVRRWPISWT